MPKEIVEGFDTTTPELLGMLTSEPPNKGVNMLTDSMMQEIGLNRITSDEDNSMVGDVKVTTNVVYTGVPYKARLCPFKAIGKSDTDIHKRCTSNCMLFNHAKGNCNINVIAENIEVLHKWEITK